MTKTVWDSATREITPLENFPVLPRYAPIFFFQNLGGFKLIFFLLTVVSVVASSLGFVSVYLVGELVSQATTLTVDTVLGWYLPALIVTFLLKEGLDFFTRRYGESFATVYADHLSLRFYLSILQGELGPLQNIAASRSSALVGKYVGHVRGWADNWFWGVSRHITLLVIIGYILYVQSPWVLLGNILYLTIFLVISFFISRKFSSVAEALAAQEIDTNTTIGGFILNLPVVRRLGVTKFFRDQAISALTAKWWRFDDARRFHAWRWFLQLSLYWVSYLSTLTLGTVAVVRGELPVGFLILIKYAFDNLYGVLTFAIEYWVQLVQQRADAELLERELSCLFSESAERSLETPVALHGWRELVLQNATAKFTSEVQGGRLVSVTVANLVVTPGARVGILGPSGVGKSTVLHMLLGTQPFEGQVTLDGRSIKAQELSTTDVVLINSSDALFNLSLYDNVALGRTLPKDTIEFAIRTAMATDFLKQQAAEVGDAAVNLSAGQLQRIRIARGLAQPRLQLILLDEAFNGIDFATTKQIMDNICSAYPTAAIIMVTHNQEEIAFVKEVYRFVDGVLEKQI